MCLISKSIVLLATYILSLDYVFAHVLDSLNPSIILTVSLFIGLNERKKVTKNTEYDRENKLKYDWATNYKTT